LSARLSHLATAALLLGSAVWSHAETTEAPRPFRIRQVSGSVVARLPFDTKWRRVKEGQSLPEGALLQVESDSRVAFDYPAAASRGAKDRVLISIKAPIVARFDRGLLRDVKVESQFVEPPPESTTFLKPETGKVVGHLRQAWEKFIATVRSDQDADGASKDIEEKRVTGTIDILRPAAGGVVGTANPTSGLSVVWRPIGESGAVYNLKVWPADSPEPSEATAQTTSTEHVVKPTRYGRYYVSVWTPSGDWQSPLVAFELVPETMAFATGAGAGGRGAAEGELVLVTPPDHLVVKDGALPYYLDCSWRDYGAAELEGAISYEVIVRDAATDVVRARISTPRTEARLFLPVRGSYGWQVRAVQTIGAATRGKRTRSSSKRFFSLEEHVAGVAQVSQVALRKQLAELLTLPGRSVLLFERGL
jgi:hypothetical protein